LLPGAAPTVSSTGRVTIATKTITVGTQAIVVPAGYAGTKHKNGQGTGYRCCFAGQLGSAACCHNLLLMLNPGVAFTTGSKGLLAACLQACGHNYNPCHVANMHKAGRATCSMPNPAGAGSPPLPVLLVAAGVNGGMQLNPLFAKHHPTYASHGCIVPMPVVATPTPPVAGSPATTS